MRYGPASWTSSPPSPPPPEPRTPPSKPPSMMCSTASTSVTLVACPTIGPRALLAAEVDGDRDVRRPARGCGSGAWDRHPGRLRSGRVQGFGVGSFVVGGEDGAGLAGAVRDRAAADRAADQGQLRDLDRVRAGGTG